MVVLGSVGEIVSETSFRIRTRGGWAIAEERCVVAVREKRHFQDHTNGASAVLNISSEGTVVNLVRSGAAALHGTSFPVRCPVCPEAKGYFTGQPPRLL
jgi:hypothetical protein